METLTKQDQTSIAVSLADAIASFNMAEIEKLLSDKGEYDIQHEDNDPIHGSKTEFTTWLNNRFKVFKASNEGRTRLNYDIDHCLYCKIGNPVIIFEGGKFPVNTSNPWVREKIGLMLEFDGDKICGITFCGLFARTDNPFRFENKCLKPE